MKIKNRQSLLVMLAIGAVALFAGDSLLFTPLVKMWKARAERIESLRKQVNQGEALIKREKAVLSKWDMMRTNTLPIQAPMAEQRLLRTLDGYALDSRLTLTSITPQWKHDADDYTTLECRVDAVGNLSTISRFLFDLENNPLGFKLENVELTARDAEGQQITLGLQLSGLVLNQAP